MIRPLISMSRGRNALIDRLHTVSLLYTGSGPLAGNGNVIPIDGVGFKIHDDMRITMSTYMQEREREANGYYSHRR